MRANMDLRMKMPVFVFSIVFQKEVTQLGNECFRKPLSLRPFDVDRPAISIAGPFWPPYDDKVFAGNPFIAGANHYLRLL
jgi:hypothetical protein